MHHHREHRNLLAQSRNFSVIQKENSASLSLRSIPAGLINQFPSIGRLGHESPPAQPSTLLSALTFLLNVTAIKASYITQPDS